MKLLKATALIGILGGMVVISCASAQATPRGLLANNDVSAQSSDEFLSGEFSPRLHQAQYRRDGRAPEHRRYPPRGRSDRGDDTGAAIAAGIFGLILGGIIAAEVQRHQQAIAYCAQRFRSYDPQSMTYLGYDGQRHPCP